MNRLHRWFCRSEHWARAVEQQLLPWVFEGTAELGENVLEVGPGPGRVTDVLCRRAARVTSIEIDDRLAKSLETRYAGTNVTVVHGDATEMPFEDARFSSAVCLTMLHHVPSPAHQDRLIAEVRRVLRPGAPFIGSDSRWSWPFHLMHVFDTMVLVDPDDFGRRLQRAGFVQVRVDKEPTAFRFRAECPR